MMDIGLSSPTFMIPYEDEAMLKRFREDPDLWPSTREFLGTLPFRELFIDHRSNFYQFLDSEPKHFHGDIIITDPCYVLKANEEVEWKNDQLSIPSFPNAIGRGTIYGDWSCTTFDKQTKLPIGHFCADGGAVAVFLLNDILAYDPDYNDHLSKDWTATHIKNFDGDIWFSVKHHARYNDYSVHVEGKGTDFIANRAIEFISKQTGL